jgi:hypothetical protein
MSEWWTYSLSDFLLFSPRTYYRLFELYNTDLWPAHVLALTAGLAILASMIRDGGRWRSAASVLLAACWVWIAWAFLLGRYATINWAAAWFAGVFLAQAVLLVLAGAGGAVGSVPRPRRAGAITLLVFALVVYPLIGIAVGRPWTQAEVFAMTPDPTALGTLGFALLAPTAGRRWLLLAIPLIWCAVSGATLWTMGASEAPVLPAAGLVALIVAASRR